MQPSERKRITQRPKPRLLSDEPNEVPKDLDGDTPGRQGALWDYGNHHPNSGFQVNENFQLELY
ncbi:hypothetical protein T265_11546 [Opisthorchis viverrini]|uniref:Uncharacterized protein n=1 Tax=Opisthorchis viverrini TaxID=6198 RepID=A0A074Z2N1_OPIVI|nr:hypothetical protein T265_11546 [Opisthorchis viverrini]KER19767.1 hypothetical protein T265_11546 [Opisthorchis viverrini]